MPRYLVKLALIIQSTLVFGLSAAVAFGQANSDQTSSEAITSEANSSNIKAMKILLVTGGCCHDYEFQTKAIQLATKNAGMNVDWTVVNEGGRGTEAQIELYDNPDWAKGFDVVIHNECFADTKDTQYIRKITDAHKAGIHAVVIHCAMHTYRSADIKDWRELLGVTSNRHDHQSHYPVRKSNPVHPIVRHIPDDYKSAMDELYIIEKIWPNTIPLAFSKSERDGKEHPVFWINHFGMARVFGTSYGHSNETFADDVFLKTLAEGIRWAAYGDPDQK